MKQLLVLIFSSLGIYSIQAQGCSDAGFCSLKYGNHSNQKNSITMGNVSGVADGNTFVNGSYVSYQRQFSSSFSWETKFTTNYASGKLANNFNVGDIFTNVSYTIWQNKTKQNSLTGLIGLKIPLTVANDKAGGKPLPMAYQASLGTYDLLLGGSVKIKHWEFTNAWQIPLNSENKNTFFKEYSVSNDFPTTNKFSRRSDVLLRAAYSIKMNESKWLFKPNLLAIYHLGEDEYEDIYGKRQSLNGSDGLTLNANIITRYAINTKHSVELSLAAPFVVRKIRPDGLTRKFTAGIEYKISF